MEWGHCSLPVKPQTPCMHLGCKLLRLATLIGSLFIGHPLHAADFPLKGSSAGGFSTELAVGTQPEIQTPDFSNAEIGLLDSLSLKALHTDTLTPSSFRPFATWPGQPPIFMMAGLRRLKTVWLSISLRRLARSQNSSPISAF